MRYTQNTLQDMKKEQEQEKVLQPLREETALEAGQKRDGGTVAGESGAEMSQKVGHGHVDEGRVDVDQSLGTVEDDGAQPKGNLFERGQECDTAITREYLDLKMGELMKLMERRLRSTPCSTTISKGTSRRKICRGEN